VSIALEFEHAYDQSMGERAKATAALGAWLGDRPTLAERVGAPLPHASRTTVGDAEDLGPDTPAPETTETAAPLEADTSPSASGLGMPMPPAGAHGSWVWVALPDGAGTICARAVQWVRVKPCDLAPTGWALRVYSPYWRALADYVGGGVTTVAMHETQIVPSSRVTPIPGHYEGVPQDTDAP
jgi:hypothetical protein